MIDLPKNRWHRHRATGVRTVESRALDQVAE